MSARIAGKGKQGVISDQMQWALVSQALPSFPYLLLIQVLPRTTSYIPNLIEIFPDLPTSEITFSSHTHPRLIPPLEPSHWQSCSESFVNNLFLPSNFDLLTITWAFLIQNASQLSVTERTLTNC